MLPRRLVAAFALLALSVPLSPLMSGCSAANMRGKHWATNLPEFDLKACFPRQDRDWGDDTRVQGMWVAVTDVFPRLSECSNDLFFRHGEFEEKIEIRLVVQPDHSVVVEYDKKVKEPEFDKCVADAISMISLPESSEAGGTTFPGYYEISNEGDDVLMVDGSTLGTVVGKIRISTLGACACLEPYKDKVPPDMKFKFVLPANDPHPADIKLATKGIPNDFARCMRDHLREIPVGTFGEDIKASYRFKFSNSRAFNVDRLVADGLEALNRRSYAEAEELFNKVLAVAPTHDAALRGLGEVRLENNQPQQALELFTKAEESKESSLTANDIGRAYMQLGDYEKAVEWCEEAVDRDDTSEVAHYNLASSKLGLDDFDDAQEAANTARKLNAKYAPAYVVEARALVGQKKPKKALKLLEKAAKLDLKEPSVYEGMASVFLDLERFDDATNTVKEARKKGFDSAYLRYLEGWSYARQDKRADAGAAFCKASEMAPDEAEYNKLCKENK